MITSSTQSYYGSYNLFYSGLITHVPKLTDNVPSVSLGDRQQGKMTYAQICILSITKTKRELDKK